METGQTSLPNLIAQLCTHREASCRLSLAKEKSGSEVGHMVIDVSEPFALDWLVYDYGRRVFINKAVATDKIADSLQSHST